MPNCKFCGAETGNSKFCQNCGAKVEEVAQVAQPQFQQPVIEQPMIQQPPFQQAMVQPPFGQYQPNYYTPAGAGGLLAGNIILIVLGAICCCFLYYPVIYLVLGIIGTVYASKVRSSHSAEEEAHNRKVARIMMLVGFGVFILGIILIIGGLISEYGSLSAAYEALKETIESAYESVSESMENAFRIR